MVKDDGVSGAGGAVARVFPSVRVVESGGTLMVHLSVPEAALGTAAAEVAVDMTELVLSAPWWDRYEQLAAAADTAGTGDAAAGSDVDDDPFAALAAGRGAAPGTRSPETSAGSDAFAGARPAPAGPPAVPAVPAVPQEPDAAPVDTVDDPAHQTAPPNSQAPLPARTRTPEPSGSDHPTGADQLTTPAQPQDGELDEIEPGEVETDEAPGVREEWESRYGLVSAPAIFLERLAPGGRLASVLGALCVADADDATVVEAIAGAERLASWAMAVQARAVRELTDRRGPSSQALSSVGAEISARLGITGYAGQAKVHFAAALDLFPEVADALTTGRIDTRKADVLLNREDGLPLTEHRKLVADLLGVTIRTHLHPDHTDTDTGTGTGTDTGTDTVAADVDATPDTTHPDTDAGADTTGPDGDGPDGDGPDAAAAVTLGVEDLTGPQLREHLRLAAITAGGIDTATKRRAKAYADRHVRIEPAPENMAWISAFIRADQAEATRVCLDALAAVAKGPTDLDPRTLDQRRADVFTDVFTTILTRGVDLDGNDLPTYHGVKPQIQVTIAAPTLLGLNDQPAQVSGYGPIPADLARQIAQDGTWRGLFTDATGCFRALGSKKYRPGADLSRQVIARDIICTFPGCRQPAWKADLDHIASYDPAIAELIEQTTKIRLQALCRRHHNLKTNKWWTATRDETTGAIIWTALTGHTYTRPPPKPLGRRLPTPNDDDDPPY